MNTDLMKYVETIVRPIHAPVSRKLRMREELYLQLEQIYLEESAKQEDPLAALPAARERFGNPGELRKELQATVPVVIATIAGMDHWIAGRREGETPLKHALRVGIRFSALIVLSVILLVVLANPGGGQIPSLSMLWPFIATAGLLFGLNTFAITLCGRAMMTDIAWNEGRMRIRRRGRAVLRVLAVGLLLGFSEAVMWCGSASEFRITDGVIPFIAVTLAGAVVFSTAIGLLAYDQRGLNAWNELQLNTE